MSQYLNARQLDPLDLIRLHLQETRQQVLRELHVLEHACHPLHSNIPGLQLNQLDELLLRLLGLNSFVEQTDVQMVLDVLHKQIPVVQTAKQTDNCSKTFLDLLVAQAFDPFCQVFIRECSEILWR